MCIQCLLAGGGEYFGLETLPKVLLDKLSCEKSQR